ncbi:DEAD/DEAH box helicase family protein [Chryseobacterium sp.]|uniref:DEAD/DEAH box helicase family protein n=1 Tax=Chryseobacterium sp. TaxID=1871047 RepID=UPI0012A8EC88|nr:DEAD/DEAH box helicase family protein [Chryseobacterium sp.]QFG52024.1 hypothetical protein F7R58_00045 [Chryseobacterium sp.]
MYEFKAKPNPSEIDYKTIRPEDFPGYNVKDQSYITIKPNENGYISEFLAQEIDLEHKDTTVINASVGQGKTTALISIANEYADKRDYVVFIVAPFKSLLDQYKQHLLNVDVDEGHILDYRTLEYMTIEKDKVKFAERKFQLMTFNFLLANSGDRYLKQADHKIEYLDFLLEEYRSKGKKVVIIFDEIHDAIHNFKEELVFNIFRWKDSIHKIFVSSATFNESSKVVIKYLAELTDQKIIIFESPRLQEEGRVNDLNILVYDKATYDLEDPNLMQFFNLEIGVANKINILTYTRSLAHKFIRSQIGIGIRSKYGPFNVCTGDTETVFSSAHNNIGTTFKTGISIDEENTAFYIFLPSRKEYFNPSPNLGIFSDGINSLIQALARLRKKGRIYVITPDMNTQFEEPDRRFPKSNALLSLSDQDRLLSAFYSDLKNKLYPEIEYLQGDRTLIKASFPDYNQYKLANGERFFRTYFDIYGRNITNYFNWASSNNQFVNCRLNIVYKLDLRIEESKILEGLMDYFLKTFSNDPSFRFSTSFVKYDKLRRSIFSNHVILVHKLGRTTELEEYKNVTFEKHIIKFIQNLSGLPYLANDLGSDHEEPSLVIKNKESLKYLEPFKIRKLNNYVRFSDPNYLITTEEYIRNAIYYSMNIVIKQDDLNVKFEKIITLYMELGEYREKLKEYFKDGGKYLIVPNDKDFRFSDSDFKKLSSLFGTLLENDKILSKVIIPFKSGITHKSLFTLLKKVYFEVGRTHIDKEKVIVIKREMEYTDIGINLIYPEKDIVTVFHESQKKYPYVHEDGP